MIDEVVNHKSETAAVKSEEPIELVLSGYFHRRLLG